MLVGIDPGPDTSGMVVFDEDERRVIRSSSEFVNGEYAGLILSVRPDLVVIEGMEYRRARVMEQPGKRPIGVGGAGQDVFETCMWIGRFQEQTGIALGPDVPFEIIKPLEIRRTLMGTSKAKDADIRAVLLEMFGGSRRVAVGRKDSPGPLYRVSGHAWRALAVVMTYLDGREGRLFA